MHGSFAPFTQIPNQDEYYGVVGGNTSDFYMMVTTADDSYYLHYDIVEDCEECIDNDKDGFCVPIDCNDNDYNLDNDC